MYYMEQPPPEDETKRVFLRVPTPIHDEIAYLALQEDRSVNNYLNRLLVKHLASKGLL